MGCSESCMEDQRAHQSGRDVVAYADHHRIVCILYTGPNRKAASRNATNYIRSNPHTYLRLVHLMCSLEIKTVVDRMPC